jgi:hypothetical protein
MPERPRPIVDPDPRAIIRRPVRTADISARADMSASSPTRRQGEPSGPRLERKRRRFSRARRRHDGCIRKEVPSK